MLIQWQERNICIEIELEKIIEKNLKLLTLKRSLIELRHKFLASEVYQRDSIDYQARILGMIKTSIGDIKLIDKYTSNIGSVTAEQVRKVAKKISCSKFKTDCG
jgi:zinc protease